MPNLMSSTTIILYVCLPVALLMTSLVAIMYGNRLLREGGVTTGAKFLSWSAFTLFGGVFLAVSYPETILTSSATSMLHCGAWGFAGLWACILAVYVTNWMQQPDPYNSWEQD